MEDPRLIGYHAAPFDPAIATTAPPSFESNVFHGSGDLIDALLYPPLNLSRVTNPPVDRVSNAKLEDGSLLPTAANGGCREVRADFDPIQCLARSLGFAGRLGDEEDRMSAMLSSCESMWNNNPSNASSNESENNKSDNADRLNYASKRSKGERDAVEISFANPAKRSRSVAERKARVSSSSIDFRRENTAEDDPEAVAQVKEMIYRAAAFRPVTLGTEEAVERPRRKNVRISSDPQTVAARHRRERISERLRVLQKLVPGGTKMDTASMLEEAANYLKFLKSQVIALENGSRLDLCVNGNGNFRSYGAVSMMMTCSPLVPSFLPTFQNPNVPYGSS